MDHVYISTACFHDQHEYCQCDHRPDGTPKTPGVCKFCSAPCVCWCHQEVENGIGD